MAKRKPNPEMIDDDNPEWTAEDFARAKPASKVLSAAVLRRFRGAQKAATKERITIRLSPDVIQRFRASGPRLADARG
nr:BrnA antitoxin family protein [Steroidobacter denitrificans]